MQSVSVSHINTNSIEQKYKLSAGNVHTCSTWRENFITLENFQQQIPFILYLLSHFIDLIYNQIKFSRIWF